MSRGDRGLERDAAERAGRGERAFRRTHFPKYHFKFRRWRVVSSSRERGEIAALYAVNRAIPQSSTTAGGKMPPVESTEY